MAKAWLPIETAPKDGQIILAYLYDSGIREMRWSTAEEIADEEGGDPEDFISCWVEVGDESESWSPRWWLPRSALPETPL